MKKKLLQIFTTISGVVAIIQSIIWYHQYKDYKSAVYEYIAPIFDSTYFKPIVWLSFSFLIILILIAIWFTISRIYIYLLNSHFNWFRIRKVESWLKFPSELLFNVNHKAEYYLIKARYYNYEFINDPVSAFKVLENAKPKKQKLIDRIDFEKAISYFKSGAKKKADEILKPLEKRNKQYANTFLRALFHEEHGNSKLAQEILIKEINNSKKVQANDYINIGRSYFLNKNYDEAFYYYKKALKQAKMEKEILPMHIAYQNTINTALLMNEPTQAKNLLDEYEASIDREKINDANELYNLLLVYARQTNNLDLLQKTIDQLDTLKVKKITKDQYTNLLISIFRIRFNHDYEWRKVLDEKLMDVYKWDGIELKTKINALREVFFALQHFRKQQLQESKKYEVLYNNILDSFISLRPEIEKKIENTHPDAVFERVYWLDSQKMLTREGNKEFSLRIIEIKEIINIYDSIIEILESYGNYVEAIRKRIVKAEEVSVFLKQYRRNLSPDNQYKYKEMEQEFVVEINILKEKSVEYRNHHIYPDLLIQCALITYSLNDYETVHFLKAFQKTGISINHFTGFLQGFYKEASARYGLNNGLE